MPSTHDSLPKLAIVTCSTRKPRLNPFISEYIRTILRKHRPQINVQVLDIDEYCLPIYDEPNIPQHLPKDNPTPHYIHQHTRQWSAAVRNYDMFIFVTPQYNWSVPASLKNAVDFIYHEWSGKPAAVVTYGVRGGGKAAGHLQQIMTGLHMKVAAASAELKINDKTLEYCLNHSALSSDDLERWTADGVEDRVLGVCDEILAATQNVGKI